MRRIMRFGFAVALLPLLGGVGRAFVSDAIPDPTVTAIQGIVQDKELSARQKLEALEAHLAAAPASTLYYMDVVEKGAALARGVARFRDPETGRELKLRVGHELVARHSAGAFEREYASFLAGAVQDDGVEEFMRTNDGTRITAIGELAYSAGGFEGVPASVFEAARELVPAERLIDILERSLEAPDTVYPEKQGCIVMGEPGESSGRNVPRQLLPLALAKLNATGSIPRLLDVVTSHKDRYLRANAVYAVARIGSPNEVRQIEEWTLRHDREVPLAMFELGRGMAERGDDRGVQYLLIRRDRSYREKDLFTMLYLLEQRLDVMERSPVRNVTEFYKEALNYGPLRRIWLYDADRLAWTRASDIGGGRKSNQELLDSQRDRILKLYTRIVAEIRKRGLSELTEELNEIARKTKDDEIRSLSRL